MTVQAEYDAGISAALTIAHADIKADVPVFIQPEVPMDVLDREVTRIAKAVIDAAAAVRAKAQQVT
jgi:hypothetical protein